MHHLREAMQYRQKSDSIDQSYAQMKKGPVFFLSHTVIGWYFYSTDLLMFLGIMQENKSGCFLWTTVYMLQLLSNNVWSD